MVLAVCACTHRRSAPDEPPARAQRAERLASTAASSPILAPLAAALPPAVPPFAGGALSTGNGWVRRTYTRGLIHVVVTLAAYPSPPAAYAEWVRQSASYPPAPLPLPADAASGFYSCAAAGSPCDLHAQLRAGYHLELMGEGTASRDALHELVSGLRLGILDGTQGLAPADDTEIPGPVESPAIGPGRRG